MVTTRRQTLAHAAGTSAQPPPPPAPQRVRRSAKATSAASTAATAPRRTKKAAATKSDAALPAATAQAEPEPAPLPPPAAVGIAAAGAATPESTPLFGSTPRPSVRALLRRKSSLRPVVKFTGWKPGTARRKLKPLVAQPDSDSDSDGGRSSKRRVVATGGSTRTPPLRSVLAKPRIAFRANEGASGARARLKPLGVDDGDDDRDGRRRLVTLEDKLKQAQPQKRRKRLSAAQRVEHTAVFGKLRLPSSTERRDDRESE